jgi:beta-glucanase (GH16 family)
VKWRHSDVTVGHRRAQRATCVALAIALVCTSCNEPVDDVPALGVPALAAPAQGAAVIWSEEFDGSAGQPPNASRWNLETGGGGWGNNELQTYTDTRQNSYLDGQGDLVIAARKGTGYTSARLNTLGKFAIQDGVLSARIRLPAGRGLLPAFWLLGTDMADVGWPRAGEIDVIETPNTGTEYNNGIHGPAAGTKDPWKLSSNGSFGGVDLSDDFHVYSVAKSRDVITISIDGIAVGRFARYELLPGQDWVFDKPAYVVLTIAVGGDWPGQPDDSTPNPALMYVDWLRAYNLG